MLIRFRARNFRSLKDQQELSLVASSLKDSPEAVTQVDGLNLGLLRVAAIYGANASGKTNVIKAVQYMSTAVQDSQRQWPPEGPIPREPFLLGPDSKNDRSSFEVDLALEGGRFHYGFTLNDREVLEEWLDVYPTGRGPIKKQMWFKREAKSFTFGKKLTGENRAIESLTRPNSLFLSAAAQNNHELLLPVYGWFAEQFKYVPRERGFLYKETAKLCRDDKFKSSVSQAISAVDLGIVGLGVMELDLDSEEAATARVMISELGLMDVDVPSEVTKEALGTALPRLQRIRTLARQAGLESIPPEKMLFLWLFHKTGHKPPALFTREQESDGTVALLGLLGPVLRAIGSGGTLCVDELDASLHPLLALRVVHLFSDHRLNPRGAQIVFTTHDTNILDRAPLRRDQIWFTEKDAEGGTHLYPLTDFKPRKNENIERGYLQGRYGAIPFIGSADFLARNNEASSDAAKTQ